MENQIISVVMPTYNGSVYIQNAIVSVYRQDVPLELIVIDDCSDDDTVEQVKKWTGRKDFIYHRNCKNLGAAQSRNIGVQKAKGKYIAFLDSDDWWEDGKLKEQLKRLEQTGKVLCSTGRELMAANGHSLNKYITVKEKITYRDLLKHNCINCSSVVILRSVALEFPMCHDESHEDYITWLRVLKKYGEAVGINKPYLKSRQSAGGKSRNKIKSAKMTFQVYRYMGYGWIKSCAFFVSYVVHGVLKYM